MQEILLGKGVWKQAWEAPGKLPLEGESFTNTQRKEDGSGLLTGKIAVSEVTFYPRCLSDYHWIPKGHTESLAKWISSPAARKARLKQAKVALRLGAGRVLT